MRDSGDLLAPDWLRIEVANALWKQWCRNAVDPEQIDDILGMLPQLLVLGDVHSLAGMVSSIAHLPDHSVYYCLYLALAETNHAPLVADDRVLLRKATRANFPVRPLRGSMG